MKLARWLPLVGIFLTSATYAQNFDFVADYLRYEDGPETVYLEGAVELKTDEGYFYVESLTYDLKSEIITVDGTLQGIGLEGERFITSFSELDFASQTNILREAKIWLSNQMQISAKIAKESQTYQYAENVTSSRCTVCALNPIPIWQVRAQQAYRDIPNQKIYFKNAFFDLFGIPLLWTPRLRVPAPDAVRQSGFLAPKLIITDTELTGIKIPYYHVINDYSDLHLNNYFTTSDIRILETRYRQNFKGGSYQATGAYAFNDGNGTSGRYYLQHNLNLNLPYDFRLTGRFQQSDDHDFMNEFDYSDWRYNQFKLSRYQNHNYITLSWRDYIPSSEAETKSRNYPTLWPRLNYVYQKDIGQNIHLETELEFLDLDNDFDEQDIQRITGALSLERISVIAPGVLVSSQTGAILQNYEITNLLDSNKDGNATRLTPHASLDISLPLAKFTEKASYTLTPELFLSWSENYENGIDIPNSDSLFAEHDYVSLFSENRYVGRDRYEEGFRASFGASYGVHSIENERFEIGLGGVWRAEAIEINASNTEESFTDWVGYLNYEFNDKIGIYSRFAFDEKFEFSRSEVSLTYQVENASLDLDWVRIEPEPELGFQDVRSEILLNGNWHFHPNWEIQYDTRIDLISREAFDAELTLIYGNECIEIEGNVEWDFERSTGNSTNTKYSLGIDLIGLTSNATNKWGKRKCRY